jgi:hypothetical protein
MGAARDRSAEAQGGKPVTSAPDEVLWRCLVGRVRLTVPFFLSCDWSKRVQQAVPLQRGIAAGQRSIATSYATRATGTTTHGEKLRFCPGRLRTVGANL